MAVLPTPTHRLDRLSAELGIDLWIKRDDLTGFAFGGNKGRKLEYLLGDLLSRNVQAVVTCGSAQSNFVRQLGVACALFGLRCVADVMEHPYEPGRQPARSAPGRSDQEGNALLSRWAGVELRWHDDGPWDELFEHAQRSAESLKAEGLTVEEIPVGGSSPLGAYAFVQATREAQGFDHVVCPCSSGSTHAGLGYAFCGTPTKVVGIACDPEPELVDELARLSRGLDEIEGLAKRLGPDDFDLRTDSVGGGYGIPSDDGREAFELMLRTEGIFLDPVYSAKAFAGLIKMARRGELTGRTLFWHTGGLPSLFAPGAMWAVPVK